MMDGPGAGGRPRGRSPTARAALGRLGPDAVARGAAALPIQAFLNGAAVPAARHPAAADEIRPTGTGRVG